MMYPGKNIFKLSAILIILLVCLTSSCQSDQLEQASVKRFDIDLFSLNQDSLTTQLSYLAKKYPEFLPIFTEHIIGIGPINDPNLSVYLKQFVNDPVILEIYSTTKNNFENLKVYSEQIYTGIANYHKQIGSPKDIDLIAYISGFNQSFVALNDGLAIGLDNYLGVDCNYYKQLRLPEYIILKMSPEYIVADAMRAWIQSELEGSSELETLLDNLIYEGKILYTAIQALDKNQKLKVLSYSQEQYDWCEKHEKIMWEFLVENEMLFSSDAMMIQRLSREAPFTRDFGMDSPPKAGAWIGYRIIEKFMAKNKVGLEELLFQYNAADILAKSAYRP